jgi:hypothetical protein
MCGRFASVTFGARHHLAEADKKSVNDVQLKRMIGTLGPQVGMLRESYSARQSCLAARTLFRFSFAVTVLK